MKLIQGKAYTSSIYSTEYQYLYPGAASTLVDIPTLQVANQSTMTKREYCTLSQPTIMEAIVEFIPWQTQDIEL